MTIKEQIAELTKRRELPDNLIMRIDISYALDIIKKQEKENNLLESAIKFKNKEIDKLWEVVGYWYQKSPEFKEQMSGVIQAPEFNISKENETL
jgi:uncharacterized lipoprotein YehR (DUF1307 family)